LNWKVIVDSVTGAEPGLAVEVMAIWAWRGSPTFPSPSAKQKSMATTNISEPLMDQEGLAYRMIQSPLH
jgi:hypothetical protein